MHDFDWKKMKFWPFEHYEKAKKKFKISVLEFVEGIMLIRMKQIRSL